MLLRPEVTLSSHYSPEPQRVLSGSCALRPQTFLCSLSPGSALFVLGRDNALVALLESLLPRGVGSVSSYFAFEVSSLCSPPLLSVLDLDSEKIKTDKHQLGCTGVLVTRVPKVTIKSRYLALTEGS